MLTFVNLSEITNDFQEEIYRKISDLQIQIHKSFKLYGRFHRKIENTEYDLSTAILGCANTKPPQFVRNSDDGGQSVSLKIFSNAVAAST